VVVAVGVLLERGGSWARRGLFGLAVVVAVGGAVTVLAVLSGIGPAQRIAGASSLTAREWYWSSALSMWRQHPVVGVGLDRFGAHYRSVRPSAAADVSNYSDAAHSVPLHLLATGGLLLGLAYLAVVALVAWALVTGLRRLAGEERLLLAALGGAWTAYQAQSLVSIDEPGLAVTHWVLASAVVAVSTPRLYERRLPGAVEPRVRKGRRADVAPAPPTVWSAGTVTICTLAGLAGVIAFWFALEPLRANYAARGASVALASGDGDTAFAKLNAATRIAPYEGSYWLQRGRFLEQVKQDSLAAQSYAAGVRHDPWSYDVLVAGARLAKAKQDASALDRYSHLLERVDPSGGWRQAVNG
jgi:tetratricopeptide (TPR) repeat protein